VSEAENIQLIGLLRIADQVVKIHTSLKSYKHNACNGEMSFHMGLSTWDNHNPVRVELTTSSKEDEDCTVWMRCDPLERMASAFERIADAMTGKAHGMAKNLESLCLLALRRFFFATDNNLGKSNFCCIFRV